MENYNKSYTSGAGMHTGPVSTVPYISEDYYEMEKEKVFRRSWLVIGREEEIPNLNDYMLRDIEVCGAQLVVVRTKTGGIRSFHNVCSHRGTRVVLDKTGNANRFVCRYHSWTYKNEGDLVAIPDNESFFDVDKKACGLVRVTTDIWNGFIFINLQENPEVTLGEFLGEFGEVYGGIKFPFSDTPMVIEATLDCNWKVISDAFSESYHVGTIHPKTIGSTFVSKDNPYGRFDSIRFFGPHHSATTGGNPEYKLPSKNYVEKLTMESGDGEGVLSTTGNSVSARNADAVASFLSHSSINPNQAKVWTTDINVVFPNFHFDTSPAGFWTHQFWPLAHNKTRWESRWYIPNALNIRERFQQEHYTGRLYDIMVEDIANTERQQAGMESRAKKHVVFQDHESMCRHLLHHIEKWITSDSVKDALSTGVTKSHRQEEGAL